jgi:tetratricopeptide (TPR) repeat protein
MLRSIRQPLLAVALAGTVIAVPALAQQPASYPPACDASKVSRGDVDRAHTVFLSGKQYLDESNYDKAISYFDDAYSIDCSVHAILPIIATAYERKGDKNEAVRALDEYLRRVPNAPDREHVERRIKNLNDQIAREQPSATTATSASSAPVSPPVASVAPEASALPAPATPPPVAPAETTPKTSPGAGPWILAGIGGAAAIGGVVLLGVGAGDISSADKLCPARNTCPNDATGNAAVSKGNSGRSLETAGVIVGAAGLVTLGAGLVWLFTAKHASASDSAFVTPVLAPGYAGVALGSRLPL